jgi:hypothetical protein
VNVQIVVLVVMLVVQVWLHVHYVNLVIIVALVHLDVQHVVQVNIKV